MTDFARTFSAALSEDEPTLTDVALALNPFTDSNRTKIALIFALLLMRYEQIEKWIRSIVDQDTDQCISTKR